MAKQRSPNYPAIGLSDAVSAIRAIHGQEKRTPVPAVIIAKALGYSSLSGPARVKMAALKKYGLLEGDDSTGFRATILALDILFPADGQMSGPSLREAALKPELFRELFDLYRDGSDEAIRSYLITRKGFSPAGAKQALEAFRDTIEFAGLKEERYNASDMSDKNQAIQSASVGSSASRSFAGEPTFGPPFVFPDKDSAIAAAKSSAWTWTLSIPRNVKAELRIAGDVTKADIARLKKQIEFLADSFEEESEEQQ